VTLRLHRHQSELPTNQSRRHHHHQYSTCNLRSTTMKGLQAWAIDLYLNSNSNHTTVLVVITMLRQARLISLSTLLFLPLCEFLLSVQNQLGCQQLLDTGSCLSLVFELKLGCTRISSANTFLGPPSLSNSCMWHHSIHRLPHHQHPCHLRGHRHATPRRLHRPCTGPKKTKCLLESHSTPLTRS